MMVDHNATAFPDSPIEMAAWVRDRSMRVVEELTKLVTVIREDTSVHGELPSSLHLSVSAALANAIRLAAFSSGHQLSGDELTSIMGTIFRCGPAGYDELLVRLATLEEPVTRRMLERY